MKKIFLLLVLNLFVLTLVAQDKSVEEKLMNKGAWFLFSNRMEQQDGNTILTQVEFFKKDDISSLLFEDNNRLFSVFSDAGNQMNEDLWKLLDDSAFVITDMTGQSTQIMEIIEISDNKLVLQYCDDSNPGNIKCINSTYFSTKAGWLSDREIDELNSAGVIEIKDLISEKTN